MSLKVIQYLDCGCAILEDGSQIWFPSCLNPPAPAKGLIALLCALKIDTTDVLNENSSAKYLTEHDALTILNTISDYLRK
jgi:hypothetical protein